MPGSRSVVYPAGSRLIMEKTWGNADGGDGDGDLTSGKRWVNSSGRPNLGPKTKGEKQEAR